MMPGSWVIIGQGLGLRVQKAANSATASWGRTTRLACWYPGQCPPVLPCHSPRRARARISAGEVVARRSLDFYEAVALRLAGTEQPS